MNKLNINRGFEAMIPKKTEVKEELFKNRLSFKIFNKRITFSLEVR